MPQRYITLKQSDSFKKYLEQPNWNYQPNLNITNNTIEQQQTQSVRENMYCGRTTNVPEDIPFVVAESFVQTDHSIGDLTEQRESNTLPEKSVTKTPANIKKEKPYGVTHAKKQKNEGTILIRWFIYTSSFMTSFIYYYKTPIFIYSLPYLWHLNYDASKKFYINARCHKSSVLCEECAPNYNINPNQQLSEYPVSSLQSRCPTNRWQNFYNKDNEMHEKDVILKANVYLWKHTQKIPSFLKHRVL